MIESVSRLPEQTPLLPSEAEVQDLLRGVEDPELGINIVDLGLVYGIQIDEEFRRVLVDMTLTTPACPLGPVIRTAAHAAITSRFPSVTEVAINLVWSPRWDPATMGSDDARAELGIW